VPFCFNRHPASGSLRVVFRFVPKTTLRSRTPGSRSGRFPVAVCVRKASLAFPTLGPLRPGENAGVRLLFFFFFFWDGCAVSPSMRVRRVGILPPGFRHAATSMWSPLAQYSIQVCGIVRRLRTTSCRRASLPSSNNRSYELVGIQPKEYWRASCHQRKRATCVAFVKRSILPVQIVGSLVI